MSSQIVYGQTYAIVNLWNGFGGYLDTKGTGCTGGATLCVSAASSRDRDNGSGTWQILSANGKPPGSSVLVDDTVYLLNLYPYNAVNGGYLFVSTGGCQNSGTCITTIGWQNMYSVILAWRIWSATGKPSGSPVMSNDHVWLQNTNGGSDSQALGFLYTTGSGSGCDNFLCVANDGRTQNGPNGTWIFLTQER